MKNFIELFTDARAIGTPLVAIKTFDNASVRRAIKKSLGDAVAETPLISWDAINGLRGLTDEVGVPALTEMCNKAEVDRQVTVDLAVALAVCSFATQDHIIYVDNPHMFWDNDKKVVQGFWNLRDKYKANGNMVVILFGPGDTLPAELQQDTLILEEPLPTESELATIVTNTYKYAAQNKKYAACKAGPSVEIVKRAVDAGIGLPTFPYEQTTAMSLDKENGVLDIEAMWDRKRAIVSQRPGLGYHNGGETLKDMYGCESARKFGVSYLEGKYSPTLILRQDEIEKQFAGAGTDSSGTKGNLLGEWLEWVNDNGIICSLFYGIPGSSKSWTAYCMGGEYHKPVINYSIPGMEHEHVGASQRNMRNAHKTLNAISGGKRKIWLIATANRINQLPAEVISRFQVGGIWFFDAPDAAECKGIMDLKVKRYGLDPNQPYPDMNMWTGRDIDNCAIKAQLLGMSLVEAAQFVVPMMASHKEQMNEIREHAHNRYLSASKSGLYQYVKPTAEYKHQPKVSVSEPEGRKMR
jgi:hypothetical protein